MIGDSWQHEILLEKILEPEPNVRYPRCVEGARACPPRGRAAASGAMATSWKRSATRSTRITRDMMEWVGGKFDPEKFLVDKVNKELRKG